MIDYQTFFSTRAAKAKSSPLDELFRQLMQKPEVISFAVGAPDSTLLPLEVMSKLTKQTIKKYGRGILQYGMTQGFPPLRAAVLPLLAKRGITCESSSVHIATGGSGALNNICMALLDRGDTVLVEKPSYSSGVKTFLAYEPNLVDVASDEEGMIPEVLEKLLRKKTVKCIYLLPTFQNPTGRTMSLQRRKLIGAIIKKYKTLVIEDDVYYDLRFQGENIPAFYTFAPENTMYLTSLSKTFAPAMRIGIAVMPKEILEKVLILKQGIDMQTSSYLQALATEFLTSGYAEKQLARVRKAYSRKLTSVLLALKRYMPQGFFWNQPEGGMFLWVTGPKGFDADALLPKAIESGVAFLPGSGFYLTSSEGRNTLRLNFASLPEEKIEKGIKILAQLCKG